MVIVNKMASRDAAGALLWRRQTIWRGLPRSPSASTPEPALPASPSLSLPFSSVASCWLSALTPVPHRGGSRSPSSPESPGWHSLSCGLGLDPQQFSSCLLYPASTHTPVAPPEPIPRCAPPAPAPSATLTSTPAQQDGVCERERLVLRGPCLFYTRSGRFGVAPVCSPGLGASGCSIAKSPGPRAARLLSSVSPAKVSAAGPWLFPTFPLAPSGRFPPPCFLQEFHRIVSLVLLPPLALSA